MTWVNFSGVCLEAVAVLVGVLNLLLFRLPLGGPESYGARVGKWIQIHAFSVGVQVFGLVPLTVLAVLSFPSGIIWSGLYFIVAIFWPLIAVFAYLRRLKARSLGPPRLQSWVADWRLGRRFVWASAFGVLVSIALAKFIGVHAGILPVVVTYTCSGASLGVFWFAGLAPRTTRLVALTGVNLEDVLTLCAGVFGLGVLLQAIAAWP